MATALFGQARLNAVTYALLTGAGARLLYDWGAQEGALVQFHRAVDYIERHYNQDLRLDALAKHVGMSVSSLHRAFKTPHRRFSAAICQKKPPELGAHPFGTRKQCANRGFASRLRKRVAI